MMKYTFHYDSQKFSREGNQLGLEVYRIKIEPIKRIERKEILNVFVDIGFSINGDNFSDIYLEKGYDWGCAEVVLQNLELGRIALNQYKSQHNLCDLIEKPDDDTERVIVQIAKPNHQNIIDSFMQDIQAFNNAIPILVINLQTKKKININHYVDLKEDFKQSQNEFIQWYPNLPYPIRCKDVFEADKKINKKKSGSSP